MKTTILTKKRFETLEKYPLSSNIFNNEGELLILNTKEKWQTVKKILKKFYKTKGIKFGNKLQTINSLIDNKEKIDIEEIVFPDSLAIVDKEIVGFTMPLIKSTNLYDSLKSKEIDNQKKIKYLKQIGQILEKMNQIRKHTNINDFYINDLHENNFIIDTNNDQIKVVDIDSCKIDGNKVFGSRYLSILSPINEISKYKKVTDGSCGGYIEPSKDSDLYCYIIIILNYLYGGPVNSLPLEEIYEFLNYLETIGLNKELIYLFENIFTERENQNPYELLDSINPIIEKSQMYSYIKKR